MASGLTVLVVDDSNFARSMIARRLTADPGIGRVETASDGLDAVDKVRDLRPDVVTLDVQMPRLDGLAALERIMAEAPTPVVMLSSLTGEDTETTIRALELGAVDFFLKPSLTQPDSSATSGPDLIETVKMAARVPVARLARAIRRSTPERRPPVSTPRQSGARPDRVVVIASSTGGPRALASLVPALAAADGIAYVIVQHMPPGFTTSLAARLDDASALSVKEAKAGDTVATGIALLAPGGYHMLVSSRGRIELTETATVHGVRPAADLTMESIASGYGRASVGVVLTGMGRDATKGAGAIKNAGGTIIAEHESTCAVYGMPRSVIEAGHADRVLPLDRIARAVAEACRIDRGRARESVA